MSCYSRYPTVAPRPRFDRLSSAVYSDAPCAVPKGVTAPGQLLLIYNGDGDPTSGDFIIPPGYVRNLSEGKTEFDVCASVGCTVPSISSLLFQGDIDVSVVER